MKKKVKTKKKRMNPVTTTHPDGTPKNPVAQYYGHLRWRGVSRAERSEYASKLSKATWSKRSKKERSELARKLVANRWKKIRIEAASTADLLLASALVKDKRDRAILELLAAGATLRAVGKKVGISYERVRQIATEALKLLKDKEGRSK